MIYGSAIISGSMLVGYVIGEVLGRLLGVGLNVGGVGFSMLCLLLLTGWLRQRGRLAPATVQGIHFWKGMYIPVVVAMSASQDVASAISRGAVAIVAGTVSVLAVVGLIWLLARRGLLE